MKSEHEALFLALALSACASGCVVVSEKPADTAPPPTATQAPAPVAANPVGPVRPPTPLQAQPPAPVATAPAKSTP